MFTSLETCIGKREQIKEHNPYEDDLEFVVFHARKTALIGRDLIVSDALV
jgi:hypothetical protein